MNFHIRLTDKKFVEVSMWCFEHTPNYVVEYIHPIPFNWGDDSHLRNNHKRLYRELTIADIEDGPPYEFIFENDEDAVLFKLRWCDGH